MRHIICIIALFTQFLGNAQNKEEYTKIIEDIKKTKEYEGFISSHKQNCKGLAVSKYKYSICSFGSFFKDGEIKSFLDSKCSEEETFKSKKCNLLKKLSDKGNTCFIADFSFKIKDKIGVKIISKKDEGKIGYESLHFLYDISTNEVRMLEAIKVTND